MGVQALFVDPRGIYPDLVDAANCWPESRDARTYAGPDPVVAHPPCNLWVDMAAVNWARYGRQRPAWYPGGTDGGCFASAVTAVRAYGGVLEHPACSKAWAAHGLTRPTGTWGICVPQELGDAFVCEVWQSAYGHAARKRTRLYYCGRRPPFELRWAREPGTHQISKRAASATPVDFAEELVRLAEWSRGAP